MTARAFDTIIKRASESPRNVSGEDLATVLACDDAAAWETAFAAARDVKRRCGRDVVLPRGLIECSNVCAKDCFYCGIRRGNVNVRRYSLSETEVMACCDEARRRGYPAVAFQAGEIESEGNTAFYERVLGRCRDLEVTLSLGEQSEETYRRWKVAGALRYLLRIETSNRTLYGRLHPVGHSFDRRVDCIRTLKRLGYVTGTGVMIGLPGQTTDDLAADIVFFGHENVDMVGMGPYIPHPDTPLGVAVDFGETIRRMAFERALRMIALTRLYLWSVNIVAATALETLDPDHGRDRGIAAGANVIMPNVTPCQARHDYVLYPGKEDAE